MTPLDNRVALITGAGRGIGRAIALAYAKAGANLSLSARTRTDLEQTAREAEALGARTFISTTDVADPAQVDSMVQQTLEQFSTIDILVNNAGIAGPIGPLQDTDVAAWIDTIQINLIGTYLCCRAVLPVMLKQNCGKIINLSGAGATEAWRDLSAYGSTKVAVVRLTETLALELADANVQINAMSPGSVHTQLWDELRDKAKASGSEFIYGLGQKVTSGGGAPIDGATALAVFLASDASGPLSGRLISATADDFENLPSHIPAIMASDALTLRRVNTL